MYKTIYEHSLKVIREGQSESGAYIACPSFDNYSYCWFRDGSFIAYAMMTAGDTQSCLDFIKWCNDVILKEKHTLEKLFLWQKDHKGLLPPEELRLPTRYTLEGTREEKDEWPNFQIDGYGAWLWLLGEYVSTTGDEYTLRECGDAVELTIGYLSGLWNLPNFDCWEEFGERIHLSTLACVAGGLKKISSFKSYASTGNLVDEICEYIESQITDGDYYPKSVGSVQVDSSLLWLAVPFDIVPVDSPAMKKTVDAIEASLLTGGLKRYSTDTYYGGGRWILLSAWLGWYYCRTGRKSDARELLNWIIECSDSEGNLPEQVAESVTDPLYIPWWKNLWGESASPLLWSHAMFLIFIKEFNVIFKEEL